MIITIGLTGSIATGKSTASKMLKNLGCIIIDGDLIAREIALETAVLQEIQKTFGDEMLDEKGRLLRKKLGEKVFADSRALEKLNEIMHPAIRERIKYRMEMIKKSAQCQENSAYVVIDGALLIEMNLHRWVDEVWVVTLPEKVQLERLMRRDDIGEEAAKKRIQAQMGTEEKVKFADVVLDNSKDEPYLQKQIEKEFERLKNEMKVKGVTNKGETI